jgi:hypothetical protein
MAWTVDFLETTRPFVLGGYADRFDEFASRIRISNLSLYCDRLTEDQMSSMLVHLKKTPHKIFNAIKFRSSTTNFSNLIRLLVEWPQESLKTVGTVEFDLPDFHNADLDIRKDIVRVVNLFLMRCYHPLQLVLHGTIFTKDEFAKMLSVNERNTMELFKLSVGWLQNISADVLDFLFENTKSNVEILHISSLNYDQSMAKHFSTFRKLKEIDFFGTFSEVLKVMDTPSSLPDIESLTITQCWPQLITDSHVRATLKFPLLKNLFLSPVKIIESNAEFPHSSIEILDLTFEEGTSSNAIIKLLESTSNLRSLRIQHRDGPLEMSELISYFCGAHWSADLESLAFHTSKFNDDEFVSLCSCLSSNKSISKLTLYGISGSDESLLALSEVIEQNTSLEILEIQLHFWTTEAIVQIIEALAVNKSIRSVIFSQSDYGLSQFDREYIGKKLCWCLETNPRIAQAIPTFIEDETLVETLKDNTQKLLNQMRILCLRSVINCSAKSLPLDLVRVILEMSSFLQIK